MVRQNRKREGGRERAGISCPGLHVPVIDLHHASYRACLSQCVDVTTYSSCNALLGLAAEEGQELVCRLSCLGGSMVITPGCMLMETGARKRQGTMLSAQAYSFHQKSKLAISLSWIGGYVNTVAVLGCGRFISHATGNTTHLGHTLVEMKFGEAAIYAYLLLLFFLGAISSAVMTEGARLLGYRSKYMMPMFVEALLLTLFGVSLTHYMDGHTRDAGVVYTMLGTASAAMGLQNATITMISGAVVRTTHVTGVITDFGLESVQYMAWYWQKSRGRSLRRDGRLLLLSTRHPSVLRLLLLLSIFASFLFGAAAAAFVFFYYPRVMVVPPILFLFFILFRDWYKPIADVREIDLLSDPELKAAGIVHSLLPAGLGICRMALSRRGGEHRAPNFQAWAERLPEHWEVIILVMQPILQLNSNALMDFESAVRHLRGRGRSLVLCGVNRPQYKAMERAGLIETIGWENLCPDMEFAISRGVDLLSRQSATAK